MPKKPTKKSVTIPRVRKLIDTTGKPLELFSMISETNDLIKAANDAKINFRTLAKLKDTDKAELLKAKKNMELSIKKEDTARLKVDNGVKQIQVQGFVSEHLDALATKLFKEPENMWKPSVLNSFRPLHNPTTSTVYSPLNSMILNNFMEKHGISNPRFITRSRAKKMFGDEITLDDNGKEIPSAYVVALKKDLLLNAFDKNEDGTLKLDSHGKPIKLTDENGVPIIYRRKAYGFAPPLVSVEQLRCHPDIPKSWLTKNKQEEPEPDNEFIRKLIDFVSDEISAVPVVINPLATHSECWNDKIVLAEKYRNPLVEFCSLSHEVMHLSGKYDLPTGKRKPAHEVRESLAKYSDSKAYRATEELTVQIAMMQFIQSFNLSGIDKNMFDATMQNHDVYNQGWASRLSKESGGNKVSFEQFKESLHVVLTESAKALRDFVDTAVIKLKDYPALQEEIKNQLGEDNVITLKIKANEIAADAEVLKNERKSTYKQKMKV
ncbi:hypothetical protein [Photobacterium damselae]|uniref:hypothetical protein n=1 Tax=Photobacterium damselae TaxID=38293 RepID=UPI0040681034